MKYVWMIFFLALSGIAYASNEPIGNFGVVAPNIYRGERLNEEADYQELQNLGVQTVISLEAILSDDQELCSKHGLNCVQFPISLLPLPYVDKLFDYEMLQKAFQFLIDQNQANKKIFFHCYHGSDRTGALASALTIRMNFCGKDNYNADQIWTKVDQDLNTYGFHEFLYGDLKEHIYSWVYESPAWICAPPSESSESK